MKTSELLDIVQKENKTLEFRLPDGEQIQGDLHITEVKNVHVDSTDCGGFKHSFQETVIQLWLDEEKEINVDWSTDKADKILNIVGNQREYLLDAEAFIEFGDSKHVTSKYAIEVTDESENLIIQLNTVLPQCKPRTMFQNACC